MLQFLFMPPWTFVALPDLPGVEAQLRRGVVEDTLLRFAIVYAAAAAGKFEHDVWSVTSGLDSAQPWSPSPAGEQRCEAHITAAIGSMMLGSSSPTPVRFSRGETSHSRSADSGAHFSTSVPAVPFSQASKSSA